MKSAITYNGNTGDVITSFVQSADFEPHLKALRVAMHIKSTLN